MEKKEYLDIVDKLNFDKDQYCIIAGGIFLMYGLKKETDDVDLRVTRKYFDELKKKYKFIPSKKFDNLYEIVDSNIEIRKEDFNEEDVNFIDGYPVFSLERQREWMILNKREKDIEKIKLIDNYIAKRKTNL